MVEFCEHVNKYWLPQKYSWYMELVICQVIVSSGMYWFTSCLVNYLSFLRFLTIFFVQAGAKLLPVEDACWQICFYSLLMNGLTLHNVYSWNGVTVTYLMCYWSFFIFSPIYFLAKKEDLV